MGDNSASRDANGLPSGWRVEIDGGNPLPQDAYSMIELDAQTCAFERPGGPSFEVLAADVVIYEKTGVLPVIGPLAGQQRLVECLHPVRAAAFVATEWREAAC
jgi:hypothetical protein